MLQTLILRVENNKVLSVVTSVVKKPFFFLASYFFYCFFFMLSTILSLIEQSTPFWLVFSSRLRLFNGTDMLCAMSSYHYSIDNRNISSTHCSVLEMAFMA